MRNIHCPKDIGFENTFNGEDCKIEQFYNDCYHCWGTAIAKRCHKDVVSEDGTLTVHVSDGSRVSRVLVLGDNHYGGLYYADGDDD